MKDINILNAFSRENVGSNRTKKVCITRLKTPTSGNSGKITVHNNSAPAWNGRGRAAARNITGKKASISPKPTFTLKRFKASV